MIRNRVRSSECTTACAFSLLLLIQIVPQAFGESYWDGLVAYEPPIPMAGGTEAGNAGVPISGFELGSEGTTNGYAQVTFQISSITTLFNREVPKVEIRSIADLKNFADASLRNIPSATNASNAVIQFDGREALTTTRPISNGGPSRWYHGVTFFWRQDPVWLKSSLFSVHVTAEKRETFDKMVASLKSVKVRSTPPPVKLAKEGMQLGISQDETRKRCGTPLDVAGPSETYVTDRYFITICFDAASSDKLALISYAKMDDPQRAAATPNREVLAAQIQPLTKSEAQEILQRHTDQGKLDWASAGENRWKRSDGAMAELTGKGLTIGTAVMWPRLRSSN